VTPRLFLGPHPCNAFALTPELPSSWPATLQPLFFGHEPKARVATVLVTKTKNDISHNRYLLGKGLNSCYLPFDGQG